MIIKPVNIIFCLNIQNLLQKFTIVFLRKIGKTINLSALTGKDTNVMNCNNLLKNPKVSKKNAVNKIVTDYKELRKWDM